MGTALASKRFPFGVNASKRPRRSSGSALTLIRRRRFNGLSAAVKVVRSIASNDATDPILEVRPVQGK